MNFCFFFPPLSTPGWTLLYTLWKTFLPHCLLVSQSVLFSSMFLNLHTLLNTPQINPSFCNIILFVRLWASTLSVPQTWKSSWCCSASSKECWTHSGHPARKEVNPLHRAALNNRYSSLCVWWKDFFFPFNPTAVNRSGSYSVWPWYPLSVWLVRARSAELHSWKKGSHSWNLKTLYPF